MLDETTMSVGADYLRFLRDGHTDDQLHGELWIGDESEQASWREEIAEPRWDAIGTRTRGRAESRAIAKGSGRIIHGAGDRRVRAVTRSGFLAASLDLFRYFVLTAPL